MTTWVSLCSMSRLFPFSGLENVTTSRQPQGKEFYWKARICDRFLQWWNWLCSDRVKIAWSSRKMGPLKSLVWRWQFLISRRHLTTSIWNAIVFLDSDISVKQAERFSGQNRQIVHWTCNVRQVSSYEMNSHTQSWIRYTPSSRVFLDAKGMRFLSYISWIIVFFCDSTACWSEKRDIQMSTL